MTNINQPVSGAAGAAAAASGPAAPDAPGAPPVPSVPGGATAPRQPASTVPGKGTSEEVELARDAEEFAALMEDAPKAASPAPSPEEGELFLSVSAMVSQAMASWRAPQELPGPSKQPVAAAGPDPAGAARLENTIETVAGIERLVEKLSVSLPSDSKPVVILRLAEDILAGAEVRLEIAHGALQVAFSGTVPGTNPFAGLDFLQLGDKLVDCVPGRDVELTVDCGETGAVETWRFPRDGSRHRRGRKESDH